MRFLDLAIHGQAQHACTGSMQYKNGIEEQKTDIALGNGVAQPNYLTLCQWASVGNNLVAPYGFLALLRFRPKRLRNRGQGKRRRQK